MLPDRQKYIVESVSFRTGITIPQRMLGKKVTAVEDDGNTMIFDTGEVLVLYWNSFNQGILGAYWCTPRGG